MARYYKKKTTYGKPFRKKSSRGKFKRGSLVKYKYQGGRRVSTVRHSRRRY